MRYIIICIYLLTLYSNKVHAQSAKSDSLFALGADLYNAGNYKEAIPIFEECDKLDKAELDDSSSRRGYSSMWLASCYYKLGDTATASSISQYYRLPPIDRRITIESDRLSDDGMLLSSSGDVEKALGCFRKCAEIELKELGEHVFYANSLYVCADCMIYLGDYNNAKNYLLKAVDIFKEYEDNTSVFSCYNKLSTCYQESNKLDSINFYSEKAYHGFLAQQDSLNAALSFISWTTSKRKIEGDVDIKNAMTIDRIISFFKNCKEIGDNNIEYAYTLFERALIYYYEGDQRAQKLFVEVKKIMEFNGINRGYDFDLVEYYLLGCAYFFGNDDIYKLAVDVKKLFAQDNLTITSEYLDVVHMEVLAGIASKQITTEYAIEEEKKILNIAKANLGTNNEYYVRSILEIAKISTKNDPSFAYQLIQEAYEIVEREQNITPHTAAITYQRMAQHLSSERKVNEVMDMLEKAFSEYENYGLPKIKSNSIFILHDYISLMADIAIFYGCIDRFNEAIGAAEWIVEIYKQLKWNKDYYYLQALNALQFVYSTIGNNIRLHETIAEIKSLFNNKKNLPKEVYYFTLQKESELALEEGNFNLAINNAKELIALKDLPLNIDADEDIMGALSVVGYFVLLQSYLASKDLDSARQLIQSLQDNDMLTSLIPSYSYEMMEIESLLQFLNDDYEGAITLAQKALSKFDQDYNKLNNSTRLSILNNLTTLAWNCDDKKLLMEAVVQQNTYIRNYIRSHSQIITYEERCDFWEKYNKWFNVQLPNYAYRLPCDTLLRECYNGLLLSKGFLLNSEEELKRVIEEKGDIELNSQYNNYMLHKLFFERQSSQSTNTAVKDSISLIIQQEERDLLQAVSKKIGDLSQGFDVTWTNVKNKLNPNELAIEFVSLPLSSDSIIYYALVLKNSYETPQLIPLFLESELYNISNKNLYITNEAATLIWEPLSVVLQDVNTIYFSSTGILNNLGIEYLPLDDVIMNEKFKICRLSSTRQLVIAKDNNSIKKASVYGGVKYDTEEEIIVADSRKYPPKKRSLNYEPFEIVNSLSLRGGISELPATKVEAEEIEKILNQKEIVTTLLIDTLATEGSFKDLSGKKINLLHIATHGFFWSDEHEALSKNILDISILSKTSPKFIEDKAMSRSGLYLAGANNAIEGKRLPDGVDDGILTAKEISQLDLRSLDLVVLSACQTGLGEIKGDGVFGLQRGFKKAGANSLLMSLWEVDDNATYLLMTQFYKNLTSGMSKNESLKNAQKYLRENNYQDPYYWAAFVLLDAID